jgi:formylglycine-generating enzyme required for sulfatase activity
VSDADGDALTIGMQVSGDAGVSYNIPATALSGHIGAGVAPGVNRRIVWNAGADWNGQLVSSAKVRVTASDGTTPAPPPGMVYIPAGVFQMGDSLYEGSSAEQPLHNVSVSGFFMDQYLVAKELWTTVSAYAVAHGYSFYWAGSYKAAGHPVQFIAWYDAVKWCNARSEKEGLTPVYYTDDAQTQIYRTGNVDVSNTQVKWSANGYRLPTEAEWEKAARGGVLGSRFPWGDTITHNNANYYSSSNYAYDVSPTRGYHPAYNDGNQPYTSPVGSFPSNSYGLYDIAGNVSAWLWDWYASGYYSDATASNDPRGPTTGGSRAIRGGSWVVSDSAVALRCSRRSSNFVTVGNVSNTLGFRCVRKAP